MPLSRRAFREQVAEAIAVGLKAYDVAEFCQDQLGLDGQRSQYDDPFNSKRGYVLERIKDKSEGELIAIAHAVQAELDDPSLAEALASFEEDLGGVPGEMKNLIFAANGPKPEIVLRDALNNVVEITKNAEYCLVYDRPLHAEGLTWAELVDWWRTAHPAADERTGALTLHRRLLASVAEGPERLILDAYARLYGRHGFALPALVPQVYLHLDPLAPRWRREPGPLERQRMDFLLLLPRRRRVVVELDGQQHYSDKQGRASPERYARMMREDRRLRLTGYEVFRVGGWELVDASRGAALLDDFFTELLMANRILAAAP